MAQTFFVEKSLIVIAQVLVGKLDSFLQSMTQYRLDSQELVMVNLTFS